MGAYVRVEHIDMNYNTLQGEVEALKDVSFTVNDGEFVSIVGPSGCGKSTILSIVAGLLKASKGKVFINDKEIIAPGNEIGYMFQKDHLFKWRTVLKNIYLGLEVQNKLNTENIQFAQELLKKYGLAKFKDYYPEQLSGGMRQRVALIRTLVLKPELLLLDEPFSALDYQTRLNMSDEIAQILKTENKTTIQVTHDIAEAVSMSDRVIILSKAPGKIKNIIHIDFDDIEPRTPLNSRKSQKFPQYFEKVWSEIND